MSELAWRQSAESTLGCALQGWQRVGGGDFAESWLAYQASGEQVFIKTHAQPPPHHFSTEAAGLDWLKAANSVRIPPVLGVSDDPPFLILEWVEAGNDTPPDEVAFGRELAMLHNAAAPGFGRTDGRTTGSLGLPNVVCNSWAEFYASQRLLPLAAIAAQRQSLPSSTIKSIERLAAKLDEFSNTDESPSRLHGDLWAGNRLVDRHGQSWLIDPACHGGHQEFDLAMMRLFGGYADACFSAYQEVTPLADGWQERVSIHQLAPLIVHAIKFGGHYRSATTDALARYGY